MPIWDDAITDRDKLVLKACGYGRVRGLGNRPALLVIDMNYNWVGDRREPVLESIKRIRHSCGEEAWDAVSVVRKLMDKARQKNIPIVYTTGVGAETNYESRRKPWKNHRHDEDETKAFSQRMEIVKEIAPEPSDIVIHKLKPSGIFRHSAAKRSQRLRRGYVACDGRLDERLCARHGHRCVFF